MADQRWPNQELGGNHRQSACMGQAEFHSTVLKTTLSAYPPESGGFLLRETADKAIADLRMAQASLDAHWVTKQAVDRSPSDHTRVSHNIPSSATKMPVGPTHRSQTRAAPHGRPSPQSLRGWCKMTSACRPSRPARTPANSRLQRERGTATPRCRRSATHPVRRCRTQAAARSSRPARPPANSRLNITWAAASARA